MNAKPIEIIEFTKKDGDRTITCCIEKYGDGSVGVFGDEIGTWIFEFTMDAEERALQRVADEGYERIR